MLSELNERGFVMIRRVYSAAQVRSIADRLHRSLLGSPSEGILRSRGEIYGSRNLLSVFPDAASLLHVACLDEIIQAAVGQQAGLVRALFFDKPPDRSWSLPWHRDRTIAVQRNDLASEHFGKPTLKAGIPHVEAPASLLSRMLTLRIHLDPMTDENGPMTVMPGSHQHEDSEQAPWEIHAAAGDVLAMRPLLSHSSRASSPDTALHRRVIHLEVAPSVELPDGYQWHSFVRLCPTEWFS